VTAQARFNDPRRFEIHYFVWLAGQAIAAPARPKNQGQPGHNLLIGVSHDREDIICCLVIITHSSARGNEATCLVLSLCVRNDELNQTDGGQPRESATSCSHELSQARMQHDDPRHRQGDREYAAQILGGNGWG